MQQIPRSYWFGVKAADLSFTVGHLAFLLDLSHSGSYVILVSFDIRYDIIHFVFETVLYFTKILVDVQCRLPSPS